MLLFNGVGLVQLSHNLYKMVEIILKAYDLNLNLTIILIGNSYENDIFSYNPKLYAMLYEVAM